MGGGRAHAKCCQLTAATAVCRACHRGKTSRATLLFDIHYSCSPMNVHRGSKLLEKRPCGARRAAPSNEQAVAAAGACEGCARSPSEALHLSTVASFAALWN